VQEVFSLKMKDIDWLTCGIQPLHGSICIQSSYYGTCQRYNRQVELWWKASAGL